MWKIPSGDCKTFPGHGERNECCKILPDGKQFLSEMTVYCLLNKNSFMIVTGKRIAVGYVDGSVKIFDLKSLAVLHHLSGAQAHGNAVSSIDCHRDNNLIVSGSLDSTAKLYNTQTGKVRPSVFHWHNVLRFYVTNEICSKVFLFVLPIALVYPVLSEY